jgi:hypothetical protein
LGKVLTALAVQAQQAVQGRAAAVAVAVVAELLAVLVLFVVTAAEAHMAAGRGIPLAAVAAAADWDTQTTSRLPPAILILWLLEVVLVVLAQSELFTPARLAHSHQRIQETCNA